MFLGEPIHVRGAMGTETLWTSQTPPGYQCRGVLHHAVPRWVHMPPRYITFFTSFLMIQYVFASCQRLTFLQFLISYVDTYDTQHIIYMEIQYYTFLIFCYIYGMLFELQILLWLYVCRDAMKAQYFLQYHTYELYYSTIS